MTPDWHIIIGVPALLALAGVINYLVEKWNDHHN